ncbi:hypothetical protein [Leucobacter sp. NPDC077196]|uniref:hypothetical protein n=1 Tax=Leucobacter sp. NPDC077196 TaxID=3154959 RepID=UPI0034142F06
MPAPEVTEWSEADGYAAAAGRDRDRSALSDVPKRSGSAGQYSHHHRQLRSRNGKHSPANLVLLTGTGTDGDHGWVHGHVGLATILGYIVHSWADPTRIPIYRIDAYGLHYDWHLQTDDAQLELCSPPTDYADTEITAALAAFESIRLNSRRAADFHRL